LRKSVVDGTFDKQYEQYKSMPFYVCVELRNHIAGKFSSLTECFEGSLYTPLYVSESGKKKLKDEHFDIWNEFDFDGATPIAIV
jgi:hypothetical protein